MPENELCKYHNTQLICFSVYNIFLFSAVKSILNFGQHKMHESPVTVEPYFPIVHDYIINKMSTVGK